MSFSPDPRPVGQAVHHQGKENALAFPLSFSFSLSRSISDQDERRLYPLFPEGRAVLRLQSLIKRDTCDAEQDKKVQRALQILGE